MRFMHFMQAKALSCTCGTDRHACRTRARLVGLGRISIYRIVNERPDGFVANELYTCTQNKSRPCAADFRTNFGSSPGTALQMRRAGSFAAA
jgi:hypothetical protein